MHQQVRTALTRAAMAAAAIMIIMTALCSCGHRSEAAAELARAEALIDSVPAHGLKALDSIPDSHLTTPRSRALATLLRIRAEHRLNMNPNDSEAMDSALTVFEQVDPDDSRHLMMAYFYSAVTHFESSDFAIAMRRALACIDAASARSDHYYLAKAHELISETIFMSFNDRETACKEASIAANYYKSAGYMLNYLFSRLDYATFRYSMNQFDESFRVTDSVASVTDSGTLIHSYAVIDRLRSKIKLGKVNRGDEDLAELDRKKAYSYNSETFFIHADFDLALGDYVKAEKWLDSIVIEDTNDFCRKNLLAIKIYRHQGEHEKALNLAMQNISTEDSAVRAAFHLNPSKIVDEHNRVKFALREQKLNYHRNLLFGIAVILLVIAAAGLILYRISERKKRLEKESLLRQIYEANVSLRESASNMVSLKDSVKNLQDSFSENLKGRFSEIDLLCISYFDNNENQLSSSAFLKEVSKAVKRMASDETVAQLEQHLDETANRIVARFRNQFKWKEADMRFIIYSFAGFSPKSVALFMGWSMSNYYVKKSRIVQRIRKENAPDAEEFLSYLSNRDKE